jgi:hypothetical protein
LTTEILRLPGASTDVILAAAEKFHEYLNQRIEPIQAYAAVGVDFNIFGNLKVIRNDFAVAATGAWNGNQWDQNG